MYAHICKFPEAPTIHGLSTLRDFHTILVSQFKLQSALFGNSLHLNQLFKIQILCIRQNVAKINLPNSFLHRFVTRHRCTFIFYIRYRKKICVGHRFLCDTVAVRMRDRCGRTYLSTLTAYLLICRLTVADRASACCLGPARARRSSCDVEVEKT